MSEELLVRHCSPTLAGIKTGSLFTCAFNDAAAMRECIRCWNRKLVRKGLRILPLRFRGRRALVYVYRPSRLVADLRCRGAAALLEERGYNAEMPERCILELIRRLKEMEEFPHEIGLFIGYPPEDVRGFIENKAAHCKCKGCWKVYGDADTACQLFEKYKKCTDIYCAMFAKGKPIERLAVAV